MSIKNRIVNVDMPAEVYHKVDALSKSLMTKALRSPAHYRAAVDGKSDEPTKAMQIGTVAHTAILEPHKLAEIVAIKPEGMSLVTKEGKAWKAENDGKIILDAQEAADIDGMAHSVRRHPSFEPSPRFKIEASVFAEDEETGLPLKARPDLWAEGIGLILDVKTTDDATEEAFLRTIQKFAYHVQAAHYIEMTGASDFVFIAVERNAPYAVAAYRLSPEWLELGFETRRRAIRIVHECTALNSWPAYPTGTTTLALPVWVARNQQKLNEKE
jgi:exodeoxyribonuclease VIII